MFCSQCGEKIEDNSKFCSKCGKEIMEIVSPKIVSSENLVYENLSTASFTPSSGIISYIIANIFLAIMTIYSLYLVNALYSSGAFDSTGLGSGMHRLFYILFIIIFAIFSFWVINKIIKKVIK